jgi:hypothetical protein
MPELGIRLWKSYVFVSVPEASVNENANRIFPHHDVGRPWKFPDILAIAITMHEEPVTNNPFGLCVLAPYAAHVVRPLPAFLLFVKFIHAAKLIIPTDKRHK